MCKTKTLRLFFLVVSNDMQHRNKHISWTAMTAVVCFWWKLSLRRDRVWERCQIQKWLMDESLLVQWHENSSSILPDQHIADFIYHTVTIPSVWSQTDVLSLVLHWRVHLLCLVCFMFYWRKRSRFFTCTWLLVGHGAHPAEINVPRLTKTATMTDCIQSNSRREVNHSWRRRKTPLVIMKCRQQRFGAEWSQPRHETCPFFLSFFFCTVACHLFWRSFCINVFWKFSLFWYWEH